LTFYYFLLLVCHGPKFLGLARALSGLAQPVVIRKILGPAWLAGQQPGPCRPIFYELGRKISAFDSCYFFQHVSMLVLRYNSILFHETFPAEDEIDTQPFQPGFDFFLVFNPGDLYYLGYFKIKIIIIFVLHSVIFSFPGN